MSKNLNIRYESESRPEQRWLKVDTVFSARLCIDKFLQNYKQLKNQKRLIYSNSLDVFSLNSYGDKSEIDLNPKRKLGSFKKHFKRVANLIILCHRWYRWARHKYERNLQRFISFSQYHDPNVSMSDFQDENAKIKAEMMNFKMTMNQPVWVSLDPTAKAILAKKVRSTEDVAYIKNTLKNMPHMRHFNRLSSDMMEKILKCCWIEEFEAKRVIAEQYQRPAFFYIILNGSLVCTYKAKEDRKSSTICFLEKGMSFGDLPLMSNSIHTASLVSRSKVQLLVIGRQSFYDIFVSPKQEGEDDSSGVQNTQTASQESYCLLKQNSLFKGWPVDMLNPQVIKTCVYNRNQIICKDTHASKYIYIVKRGFISVWTKLNVKTGAKRHLNESRLVDDENSYNNKESEEGYFKKNELLETHHKDVLYFQEKSEPLKSKDEAQTLRDVEAKMKLNEILSFLSAVKKRDRETKEEIHELSTAKPSSKIIRTLPNGTINFYADKMTGVEKKPVSTLMPNFSIELSSFNFSEGKFKLPEVPRTTNGRVKTPMRLKTVQSDTQYERSRAFFDQIEKYSECVVDMSKKFLKVQNVYPGETFGLQDILFDSQPNMQLISNGCECILVAKEFFIQNSSMDYLKYLRRIVSPYPELKDIEKNYWKHMNWKNYTEKVLVQSMTRLKSQGS